MKERAPAAAPGGARLASLMALLLAAAAALLIWSCPAGKPQPPQPDQAGVLPSATGLPSEEASPGPYREALTSAITGDGEKARAALAAAHQLPEPQAAAARTLSQIVEGDLPAAGRSLREGIGAHPESADLHLLAGLLAACSCENFDPNSVIEHLEKALMEEDDLPAARSLLLDAYGAKEMYDWALSRSQERRAKDPSGTRAVVELGRVRIWRGEYDDAIEAADEVLRHGGDIFSAGLAPAFILTGQHQPLRVMVDPEMEHSRTMEGNELAHLHAGINEIWLGSFERAANHFERGTEFTRAPWRRAAAARMLLLEGRARSLAGRHPEAIAALEQALRAAGSQAVLEYALGRIHIEAGRIPEAARIADLLSREGSRAGPGWTEPWRRLLSAEIALAEGKPLRAADAAREAWVLERPISVDCIAGHADAYFLDAAGRTALAAGRPDQALEAFEQIRALGAKGLHQPEISVMSLYHSGLALEALGRTPEAMARYRQFVRLWGKADVDLEAARDAGDRLAGAGKGGA